MDSNFRFNWDREIYLGEKRMKENFNEVDILGIGTFKLNAVPSPRDDRDYLIEALQEKLPEKIPSVFDLRDGLLRVRNQGTQGTCGAQSAACMKEWQEYKDLGRKIRLSPQFVYNNRFNRDSEGMYGRDVMRILSDIGIVREVVYPYFSKKKITAEMLKEASNFKIAGYARVRSIDDLKKALIKNGPCYIAVPVFNYGERMWKKENPKQVLQGGHAMTVCAFNKKGFVIRNSWGTNWGQNGYCIFPYEDWGCQWEVWTTLDADSVDIFKKEKEVKEKKKTFFEKVWSFIKKIFGG